MRTGLQHVAGRMGTVGGHGDGMMQIDLTHQIQEISHSQMALSRGQTQERWMCEAVILLQLLQFGRVSAVRGSLSSSRRMSCEL